MPSDLARLIAISALLDLAVYLLIVLLLVQAKEPIWKCLLWPGCLLRAIRKLRAKNK